MAASPTFWGAVGTAELGAAKCGGGGRAVLAPQNRNKQRKQRTPGLRTQNEPPRRGFLAVFLTRGHPTARFLNRMSAVFTPLKRQNAPRGAGKGCWGGLGGSMACCILGPPTLSTFPASMYSYVGRRSLSQPHKSQKQAEKAGFGGSKGPRLLLAGSARPVHGAVFLN